MTAYDLAAALKRGDSYGAIFTDFVAQVQIDLAALNAGGLSNTLTYGAREISSATGVTLTVADSRVQSVTMTVAAQAVDLPDATTDVEGRPWTINNAGTIAFAIKDNGGTDVVAVVSAGESYLVQLLDDATANGVWLAKQIGVQQSVVSETDMRLAFLLIAENAGDRLNMIDGIADPFMDETDIDAEISAAASYNAGGDFYSGTAGSDVLISGGTVGGDMTGGAGNAAAVDGTTSQTNANSAQGAAGDTVTQVGKDWGTAKTVTKWKVYASSENFIQGNSDIVTCTLQGADDSSNINDGTWTDIDSLSGLSGDATGLVVDRTVVGALAYEALRVKFSGNSGAGSGFYVCSEVEFYEAGVPANLTLSSVSFTADSPPVTGRVHVQVKENETITVNTDLKAWVSRAGATFTTAFATDANALNSTAHGLANDARLFLGSTTTLSAGLLKGVAYFVVNATTNAFGVALTSAGAPITLTDDGTGTHSWIVVSEATLVLQETLADGTRAYEDDSVDLSAQPSGTAMRHVETTYNTKDIEDHGVVLQWT